jgi:hypothetical protein
MKKAKDQIKEVIPKKDARKIVLEELKGSKIVPIELRQVVRWCNVCKNEQKLRVRHCH